VKEDETVNDLIITELSKQLTRDHGPAIADVLTTKIKAKEKRKKLMAKRDARTKRYWEKENEANQG